MGPEDRMFDLNDLTTSIDYSGCCAEPVASSAELTGNEACSDVTLPSREPDTAEPASSDESRSSERQDKTAFSASSTKDSHTALRLHSSRTSQILYRVAEIPVSEVVLLNDLPLEQYLNVVGHRIAEGREPTPVLLKTGNREYRLVYPANGEVFTSSAANGYVLRAAVYEIRKSLINEALSCIAMCSSVDAGISDIAKGYQFLLSKVGLEQKDLIAWFGQSQSAVSNKLRLCKLSPPLLRKFEALGLSERHARALLNIETDEFRAYVMNVFAKHNVSSVRAEQLGKIMKKKKLSEIGREAYIALINASLNDISAALDQEKKQYLKTLQRDVHEIKKCGIPVMLNNVETDDYVELTIRLPKRIEPLSATWSGFDPEEETAENSEADGTEKGGLNKSASAADKRLSQYRSPAHQRPPLTFPTLTKPAIPFPEVDPQIDTSSCEEQSTPSASDEKKKPVSFPKKRALASYKKGPNGDMDGLID